MQWAGVTPRLQQEEVVSVVPAKPQRDLPSILFASGPGASLGRRPVGMILLSARGWHGHVEGAYLRRSRQRCRVTRGAHQDFLPVYPQNAPGVGLVDPNSLEKRPTQVQGMDQPLRHEGPNTEFCWVLPTPVTPVVRAWIPPAKVAMVTSEERSSLAML